MSKARLIALYLPQFHPIPENDEWWGKGFTEWTNVAKAKPIFIGHQQPNLPADLGFYDLRVPEAREDQADLARQYGIEGFCYWHYWFGGGRRLLERPFTEIVQSGKPDFPFCLAWANHTWSGIWHGCPDKILIEQTYPGVEDYTAHFYAMLDAFRDPRYLKVNGRNIFAVYKPRDLKEPELFMDTWRELAIKEGLGGFHFVAMVDFPWDPPAGGFDAYTSNPPVAMVTRQDVEPLNGEIVQETLKWRYFTKEKPALPQIYSYRSFIEHAFPQNVRTPNCYPCVVPNWDNTPRSGSNGFVLHDSTPELYEQHLSEAVSLVADRPADERVVFLKSWNEWAETNYLEPDLRWGRAYLEATCRAVAHEGNGALKVHFINVRTAHHSPHSGYDRFMDHVPNEALPGGKNWLDLDEEQRGLLYRQAKEAISWYNPSDLEMEMAVNDLETDNTPHICHYLYGENSLYHTKKSRHSKKKIFVSFHQPPEAHLQFVKTRLPLDNVDGIVVVGTNQIPFFSQFIDPAKIHFVPHGVDVNFFTANPSREQGNRVLFVGNWLRDFDALVEVSRILFEKAPHLTLDVVTLEKNRHFFAGCSNVHFHSGIPEADLLRKYQEATLMLVPMKDCTANNSVLEGMACGLPIITTDIGGIRDYVDTECAVLCRKGDAQGMADAIFELFSDYERRCRMGKAARDKSMNFSWQRVSKMLVDAYKKALT
jgi:glycosyltransferase involved in cell wall biosynthesis